MNAEPATPWLNPLLQVLHAAQLGLLRLWHAMGWAGDVNGQPAWPWPVRIAADTLRIDIVLARQVGALLLLLVVVVLLLVLAVFWRRRRAWVLAAAACLLGAAPVPSAQALFTEAYPTSFHRSTTRFDSAAIVRGEAVYRARCVACHGDDGRGEGPLAPQLTMWPPDLTRGLLWQRSDGDLFWRIRHGMSDEKGRPTMPGLTDALSDADEWALIDYLQALAAGQSLVKTGAWVSPLRVPGMPVRCAGGEERALAAGHGQRLRIVAMDGSDAGLDTKLRPDPRFELVVVTAGSSETPASADCVAASVGAWNALALLAGVPAAQLAGTQFLVDREGWMRALGRPSLAAWSDADMVCRANAGAPEAPRPSDGTDATEGLARLVAWMDREPVRAVRGGDVH